MKLQIGDPSAAALSNSSRQESWGEIGHQRWLRELENAREKLLEGIGRVRNVVMSPDGLVYVAIETPGKIVRLIPIAEDQP